MISHVIENNSMSSFDKFEKRFNELSEKYDKIPKEIEPIEIVMEDGKKFILNIEK